MLSVSAKLLWQVCDYELASVQVRPSVVATASRAVDIIISSTSEKLAPDTVRPVVIKDKSYPD